MTVMHPMMTQDNRPAGDDSRGTGRGRLRMTPGRTAALVLGIPVCVALVGATALSFVADIGSSSYPVHYQFPTSATRIAVSTEGGQLTLRQAAVDRATLTGTAHYSLIRPNIVPADTNGVAGYDYQCRAPVGNCGLNATVTVPAGTAASISTSGGNASVADTTGTVSLNTGGGELSAQNVSGAVTLSTSGGNITASNVSGIATLNTGGGEIQATAIRSTGVTASTAGGDITIVFTAVPHDVNVSTGGGNITIEVPPGPTKYRITTSTDGNVSDTGVPQVPPGSPSNYEITATSAGGNITITQAAQ
jgi:hypothetical protein